MNNPLLNVTEEVTDLETSASQKKAAKWMQIIGITEGTSLLLLLFVARPLKYIGDNPILVQWIGPIHGWLFCFTWLLPLVSRVFCGGAGFISAGVWRLGCPLWPFCVRGLVTQKSQSLKCEF
jgi:hypothetical protein